MACYELSCSAAGDLENILMLFVSFSRTEDIDELRLQRRFGF